MSIDNLRLLEMGKVEIVMVPLTPVIWTEEVPTPPEFFGSHLGGFLDYHVTHQQYQPGTLVAEELREHWRLVGVSGAYGLYRRK